MTIRKATQADVDTIHELGNSVGEFTVNAETVNFWPKEVLANVIQSDDGLMFVAEDTGVVGFVIINYNHGFKKALIENIYVMPDKRGQGVGSKLLEHMFTSLVDIGCQYVTSLVPPDAQGAIELYKRSGFSQGEQFVWLDRILTVDFKR